MTLSFLSDTGTFRKLRLSDSHLITLFPANFYLFKVNNRNTKKGVKYVQS